MTGKTARALALPLPVLLAAMEPVGYDRKDEQAAGVYDKPHMAAMEPVGYDRKDRRSGTRGLDPAEPEC